MADCKRQRVDAADRLGDLPDCLLQLILSWLSSRQAVRTSVLSRRWTNLWRGVPVIDIDEREFAGDGHTWDRFEDFADHALTSIPPGTRLDAFRLHVVSCDSATSSRWIRRGLRHLPAAVSIHGTNAGHSLVCWNPHASIPPPTPFGHAVNDGLWLQRGMSACAAGFTSRLTSLRLVGASISIGFFEELGWNCPTLQELHAERCMTHMLSLASPALRRLTFVGPRSELSAAVVPGLDAPRLTFLRLDIVYGGPITYEFIFGPGPAPRYHLPALTEASLRLTDTGANLHHVPEPDHHQDWDWEKQKLKLLNSVCSFLAILTNVVSLHLHGFITMALLDNESQEFPVLNNLRNLHLEECDVGANHQVLTSILRNTPNMENLALRRCTFEAPPIINRRKEMTSSKRHGSTTPAVFWCNKLKLIEIEGTREDETHMGRVLLEIFEGMAPEQWGKIKMSNTIVSSAE